jgi:hypothetical protein
MRTRTGCLSATKLHSCVQEKLRVLASDRESSGGGRGVSRQTLYILSLK